MIYIKLYQHWWETRFTKTGWECSGWATKYGFNAPYDIEIIKITQTDKWGHPTECLAKPFNIL